MAKVDPLAGVWARLRRNASIVFGERAVFAIVNLGALAIVTHAVGAEAIGVIGLLIAFASALSTGVSFQSWQAVLRYGAGFRLEDPKRLEGLLGLTLLADLAAVAVTLAVTLLVSKPIGDWIGLPAEAIEAAPWFVAFFVLGQVHMTQIGILRLFDRIPIIAAQHAVIAVTRLVGGVIVWMLEGDASDVLLVWGSANLAGGFVLWGFAFGTLQAKRLSPKIAPFASLGISPKELAGFLSVTNLISTLEAGVYLAIMFAVTAVLGVAEAGLFHLVRQVSDALARPAEFLAPLVFPEIASLEAAGDRASMRSLVIRSTIGAAAFGFAPVCIALGFGFEAMEFLFGVSSSAAGPTLVFALAAAAVFFATFAIEPWLLSAGRNTAALASNAFPWLALVGSLAFLLEDYGIAAAGFTLLAHRLVQAGFRIVALWRLQV